MKKLTAAFFAAAACVTIAFALSITCLAVTPPVFVPDAEGKYTVSASTGSVGEYLLMVVSGRYDTADIKIAAKDVTYLAQQTAESGMVTFSGFVPLALPDSTVFLSGPAGGLRLLGYIDGIGVTVSGGLCSATDASATLVSKNGMKIPARMSDGRFTFSSVPKGVYTLTLACRAHTKYVANNFLVGSADITLPDISLYPGDVNQNGKIDRDDLQLLLSDFGKNTSITPSFADLNGDGYVNGSDLALFVDNLGKTDVVVK